MFLDEACGGDESLRQQVEVLLTAHEEAGSFIERPAFEVEARSVADDQDESVVGQTIGHYKIISTLGVGGMGEVYLAQDTRLGRMIALKLLPVAFTRDTDRLRRFQQEARAASALNHPNIVSIYEVGQIDDRHFIASEFVDGETLRHHISGHRPPAAGNGSQRSGTPLKVRDILNNRNPDSRRPRRGARGGYCAPRHQAREHHVATARRLRESAGLWSGEAH